MVAITDQSPSKPKGTYHLPSVLQFIFSVLAVILLLMGALFFGFMGILQRSDPLYDPLAAMQWAASLGFGALLVLPSVIAAFLRLIRGTQTQPPSGLRHFNWVRFSSLLLLAMPAILLFGNLISSNDDLAWIFLPPLHILAIVLPIFWLVSLVLRGLPTGSPQRAWGVFDVGLVLGPGVILFLELLAIFFIGTLSIVYIASQPELLEELNSLAQRLSVAPPDPQLLTRILEPYLTNPAFLLLALGFVSILVPLIEEMLKPVGVWFIAGFKLTPAEGFTAGVLSGAGYALFENLVLSAGTADWALAVTTRAGTAVIHIGTTALMGWSLALAWSKRQYFKLALVFLFVVFIHGLWNGLALFGMSTIGFTDIQSISTANEGWVGAALLGLFAIVIGLFAMLLFFNRRLRKSGQGQQDLKGDLFIDEQEEPPSVL